MERTELTNTIAEHPDWTLRQLGKHFGVTYQRVAQVLGTMRRRGIDSGYMKKICRRALQPCGRRHQALYHHCEDCGYLTRKQTFWAQVNFEGECWLWEGSPGGPGYGRFRVRGRTEYAHRVAHYYTHGVLWDSMYILHTCDVRLCVNPDHLRSGTQNENINGNPARGLRPRKGHNRPRVKWMQFLLR